VSKDLLAAEPLDHAGGEGGELRPAGSARARRSAPKELAPAFVWLASDEASHMTGAVVPVMGGQPML
jgi:NAD(P)-dependent dehydrogenase (short-subunit alcohol dehydrogenase family)